MNQNKQFYHLDDPALDNALDSTVTKIHACRRNNGSQVFMICGCEPGVGTTTVSINLAIAMAAGGWRVVLVDTDLRKDTLFKRVGTAAGSLSDYLVSEKETNVDTIIAETNHPSLCYIAGGAPKSNPLNLLGTQKMGDLLGKLRDMFDYVILDAPSPLAAADASMLGILSDEAILVSRWEHTLVSQIRQAKTTLEDADVKIMGIIVNRIELTSYNRLNNKYKYYIERTYRKNAPKKYRNANQYSKIERFESKSGSSAVGQARPQQFSQKGAKKP